MDSDGPTSDREQRRAEIIAQSWRKHYLSKSGLQHQSSTDQTRSKEQKILLRDIYIVITLDCERPTSETHASASGPPDQDRGAAWTQSYVDLAGEAGFPVTLFVHPEVALVQSKLFQKLEGQGACLGLHIHPWRFGDGRYKTEFGGLCETQARALLVEAIAMWQHAFGQHPYYFRPGAASANDNTYRILTELGFRGGSNSLPGRVYPDIYSVWTGAVPDPHRANSVFRQLEGDLEFVEMPISVDCSSLIEKNGRWLQWDLRPDFDVDHELLAKNMVQQLQERKPSVPVINMVTHNDHDFSDPNDPTCISFRNVLQAIRKACDGAACRAVGITLDKVCDMVLDQPLVAKPSYNPASGKVFFQQGALRQFSLL
jgi:hypothetical protein